MPLPEQKHWQEREDSHRLIQYCPQSNLLKRDTLYPLPLVDPSKSALAGVQLLLLSWRCPRNQAHANQEPPNENADLGEIVSPLVVAQDLVYAMGHHWHILPAYPAVKLTGFPGCVRWPSHKEATQLIRPTPLRTDSSPGLTHVHVIATSVTCLQFVRFNTRRTLFHAFHTAQNGI